MTTLDHSPIPAFAGTIDRPRRRFKFRCSIFVCEPKYRIVRMVLRVVRLHALRRLKSRALLRIHWHHTRTHSSWSRA
jgi:hypothetical protein